MSLGFRLVLLTGTIRRSLVAFFGGIAVGDRIERSSGFFRFILGTDRHRWRRPVHGIIRIVKVGHEGRAGRRRRLMRGGDLDVFLSIDRVRRGSGSSSIARSSMGRTYGNGRGIDLGSRGDEERNLAIEGLVSVVQ